MTHKANVPISIARSLYYNVPEDMIKKVYALGFLDMDHARSKKKSETLEDRAASLGSEPGRFLPEEWEITGAEYCTSPSSCICGQSGIKNRYILTNRQTDVSISVGGSCLKKHFLIEPKEELIEFSRSHAQPYVWLGEKYDAFIYSVLGFKNAYIYFKCRKQRKKINPTHNALLKEELSQSIYSFNLCKWQKKLERGEHLLGLFRKRRVKQDHMPAQACASTRSLYPKGISDFEKKLIFELEASRKAIESGDEKAMAKSIDILNELMLHSIDFRSQIAKLADTSKKSLSMKVENVKQRIKKLRNKLTKIKKGEISEQDRIIKETKKAIREQEREKRDSEWVEKLLKATEDKESYPEGSDFFIMGTYIKEKISENPAHSAKGLMDGARKHLHDSKSNKKKNAPVLHIDSGTVAQKWGEKLMEISKNDGLGVIAYFARDITVRLAKADQGLTQDQRVLMTMAILNQEKKKFKDLKGNNAKDGELVLAFIETLIVKIMEENGWLLEQIKKKK